MIISSTLASGLSLIKRRMGFLATICSRTRGSSLTNVDRKRGRTHWVAP